MNAAVMLFRPNLTVYNEGLRVLGSAVGTPFDPTLGWLGTGRPVDILPAEDHAWRRRQMTMLDRNSWEFVGASIDQGFFFYMMRVKHQNPQLGADLRLSSCARQITDGGHTTSFSHSGAHGGVKLETRVRNWATYLTARGCETQISLAMNSAWREAAVRFTMAWARRTLAILQMLSATLQASYLHHMPSERAHAEKRAHNYTPTEVLTASIEPEALGRIDRQLRKALRTLDDGVNCMQQTVFSAAWNSTPRGKGRAFKRLLAMLGSDDALPRQVSLRAAACSSATPDCPYRESRFATESRNSRATRALKVLESALAAG